MVKQVDATEKRLIKNMRRENLTWKLIQKITGRSPGTLNAALHSKTHGVAKKGAPKKILVKVLPRVLKAMKTLEKKAKAEEDVTADLRAVCIHVHVLVCGNVCREVLLEN